jgi:hypothetical protein
VRRTHVNDVTLGRVGKPQGTSDGAIPELGKSVTSPVASWRSQWHTTGKVLVSVTVRRWMMWLLTCTCPPFRPTNQPLSAGSLNSSLKGMMARILSAPE